MKAHGEEAAILQRLFGVIGTTNRYAVEFGARDGVGASTTHALRTQHGWTCLLLDSHPKAAIVHLAQLTMENIHAVFAAHRVPQAFDLLSIDIDGNDFHVWRALTGYAPRVVVIEYNAAFAPEQRVVMPYTPAHRWDKTTYYGASAAALVKLGREKGYTLVDVAPPRNLFFVRDADRTTLAEAPLPAAQSCGYPPARGRRWEAY